MHPNYVDGDIVRIPVRSRADYMYIRYTFFDYGSNMHLWYNNNSMILRNG